MNNRFIAIVDDDQPIRELVEAYLQKEHYRTAALASAEEAWELWRTNPPDMWILDIMLPGMDGYEFCRRIRSETEVPIIMISARDTEVDKILGLELGSDDYMVKPFSPRELVARVRRHFQRGERTVVPANARMAAEPAGGKLAIGRLMLLPEERRVFWQGGEADLTFKEYELLRTLAERPNRAYTREELLALVWGDDYFGSDRAVDHLIKRIRKKLDDIPIEAVWGHGYRLRTEHAGGGTGHEASVPD